MRPIGLAARRRRPLCGEHNHRTLTDSEPTLMLGPARSGRNSEIRAGPHRRAPRRLDRGVRARPERLSPLRHDSSAQLLMNVTRARSSSTS